MEVDDDNLERSFEILRVIAITTGIKTILYINTVSFIPEHPKTPDYGSFSGPTCS